MTFYDLEGKNKEFGCDKANDIFKLLDENGDGEIDEEASVYILTYSRVGGGVGTGVGFFSGILGKIMDY